jgi:hypothetical protein
MSTITVQTQASRSTKVLNVDRADVVPEPFPHIMKDNFIEASLYARLKAEFPSDEIFDRNTSVGGRAGRDLYRGDQAYDNLLKTSPAWWEFYEFINSPAYVNLVLDLFGNHLRKFACTVDGLHARFCDYVEPRKALADKSRVGRLVERMVNRMAGAKHKDELFVRLDLAQGGIGYGKSIHCDRSNRLTSMLVYFCDAENIGLKGGDLLLHEHLEKKAYRKYERYPKPESTRMMAKSSPTENRGIFFLCSNNSYHSATKVIAQKRYRDFVYVSVSSRAPSIW